MTSDDAHWESVREAAARAGVAITTLTELEDAERVDRVIESLWGHDAVLGAPLIRAFQHAGSILFGAEADGEFVGFVFGFVGLHEGKHVHSHMLGVIPAWQAKGVGYALKLAQRAACLDDGITDVRWTFDPLIARNARFNLVKLGAVATQLLPEFYGEMRDLLNRDDRSDRFEVRWRLRSERVAGALGRDPVEPSMGEPLLEAVGEEDAPHPRRTGAEPGPGTTVAIPRDYPALREKDVPLGREWREASAEAFRACFERDLEATWMTKDGRYVFESREDAR